MGDLKPGSFYPSPDVTSTILELKPHNLYKDVNSSLYFRIIRDLFQSRRKTIKNNLSRGWTGSNIPWKVVENALLLTGIRPDDRGENITVGSVVEFDTGERGIVVKLNSSARFIHRPLATLRQTPARRYSPAWASTISLA